MSLSKKRFAVLCAVAPLGYFADRASAASPIYGTTPFTNGTGGGYTGSTSSIPAGGANSVGLGGYEVGNANDYVTAPAGANSTNRYSTGYILTSSGTTNLQVMSGATATAGGAAPDTATSINTSGTLIAGYSDSYHYTNSANAAVVGNVEAVWKNTGSGIALPVATTDNFGDGPNNTSGFINNTGTVVGLGTVYNTTAGTSLGTGSFVWVNSGTVAAPVYNSYAELISPGNSTGSLSTGSRTEVVSNISDAGLAVGSGSVYTGSVLTGTVAVTWDTTSTPTTTANLVQPTIAPVRLISPASFPSGAPFGGSGNYTYNSGSGSGTGTVATVKTTSAAVVVNASNVIAGTANVYDANTASATTGAYTGIGTEPVLWHGAGSTGTFLPLLSSSYTKGTISGINVSGDVIGGNQNAANTLQTATLWTAASSYTPTMLAAPTGTNPLTGSAYTTAFTNVNGINDFDYTVGFLGRSANDTGGTNALLWNPSGVATDLNTLVPLVASGNGTTAGWVSLLAADAVSDDGWISGVGIYYDPNATNYSTGALPAAGDYYRPFLIQDSAAVPEPASASVILLTVGAATLRRRSSRNTSTGQEPSTV